MIPIKDLKMLYKKNTKLIMLTPTGELRNLYSEVGIILMSHIDVSERFSKAVKALRCEGLYMEV